MKLIPKKSSIALGSAFGISFLLCNIILSLLSKDAVAWLLKIFFHEMDFTPLIADNSFHFMHLLCGILILFFVGALIGLFTAIIYNSIFKVKVVTKHVPVFVERETEEKITVLEEQLPHNPIGFTYK